MRLPITVQLFLLQWHRLPIIEIGKHISMRTKQNAENAKSSLLADLFFLEKACQMLNKRLPGCWLEISWKQGRNEPVEQAWWACVTLNIALSSVKSKKLVKLILRVWRSRWRVYEGKHGVKNADFKFMGNSPPVPWDRHADIKAPSVLYNFDQNDRKTC